MPRSSLATRSRKPCIRRVFPDQGNRWIGWKEEAPHPQGGCPFPRVRMEGQAPHPQEVFQSPKYTEPYPKGSPATRSFFVNRLSRSVRAFRKPHPCKGSPYLLAKPFSIFLLMDSTDSPPYLLTKRSRP